MAAEKSYVVTDERRLMEFLAKGAKLENLELNVGILSGRDRYDPKHVGSKSRANRKGKSKIAAGELGRRKDIREMRTALAAVGAKDGKKAQRDLTRNIRRAFKARGVSSKGLVKSAKGTAVARVAGVLQSQKYGGKYHVPAIEQKRPFLRAELQKIKKAMSAGKPVMPFIRKIAEGMKAAIRARLAAAGHVDSGRLYDTTAFELIDVPGRSKAKEAARAIRAMKRAGRRR